jgi:hypothetical protein
MNAINHWCPMAMMSSPAGDDGRTPPKDMQTLTMGPKYFWSLYCLYCKLLLTLPTQRIKLMIKCLISILCTLVLYNLKKKSLNIMAEKWTININCLLFWSWWAIFFAIFLTFSNIYSNAICNWLQPHCSVELNATGTDYDPQFSHLNVTWPEKYPFLPIESPCISPFVLRRLANFKTLDFRTNISSQMAC